MLRVTMGGIALLLGLISTIQLRPWSPMPLAFFNGVHYNPHP
jgi:hypothetical protein